MYFLLGLSRLHASTVIHATFESQKPGPFWGQLVDFDFHSRGLRLEASWTSYRLQVECLPCLIFLRGAVVDLGRSAIDLHVVTAEISISVNAQGPQNEDASSCRQ